MQKKTWILIIVLIVIVSSIVYFEKEKAPQIPSSNQDNLTPELVGLTGYLNNASESIKISDFRGRVVLVDFWTYTCINCIRTFPHLIDWHNKYTDKGLVIIGVHTPEFEYEKETENVQDAIVRYGIPYLVVQDNNYLTWDSFNNRFWPRKYLIDANGEIVYDHIGEGAYEETEIKIRELLIESGANISEMPMSEIPDETPVLKTTPELYAGYQFAFSRGQNIGNDGGLRPDEIIDYNTPKIIGRDKIYLDGLWLSARESLKAESQDSARSSILLYFLGNDVNIVADSIQASKSRLDVLIDGQYLSDSQAGSDIKFDSSGKSYIEIDEPRLYNIIKGAYGEYQLQLSTNSSNFFFSAFTFG
jgi:thiol-disulfide isomerase/thioredoxin